MMTKRTTTTTRRTKKSTITKIIRITKKEIKKKDNRDIDKSNITITA